MTSNITTVTHSIGSFATAMTEPMKLLTADPLVARYTDLAILV